jgi:hypothetical protein
MSTNGFMPASFLEEQEMVQVHRSDRSWDMVSIDGFDDGKTDAWNMLDNSGMSTLSSHCGDGNFFLGGHCLTAGHEVERQFLLPVSHDQLHISATFHFIDSWAGEVAYAKVDGEYVWLDTHTSQIVNNNTLNSIPASLFPPVKSTCGSPEHPDTRLGSTFDVYVPHNKSSVTIGFGSSLTRSACNASWGVDNVHVFVR